MDQMITKDQRVEEGFWLDRIFYQINIHLDETRRIATDHGHWDRINAIFDNTESFLDRLPGIAELFQNEDSSEGDAREEDFVEAIRKDFLEYLDEFQAGLIESVFEQDAAWELSLRGNYNSWFIEYPDNELARDEHYNRLSSIFRERGIKYARDSTRYIQTVIDSLKEPIVSNAERIRSRSQERTEELDRLQQRINELREHTP